MLKHLLTLLAVGVFAIALPACNTVEGTAEGVAEDAEAVGTEIDESL